MNTEERIGKFIWKGETGGKQQQRAGAGAGCLPYLYLLSSIPAIHNRHVYLYFSIFIQIQNTYYKGQYNI